MDALFTRFCVPHPSPKLLIIKPLGKTWITGFPSSFDANNSYDPVFFQQSGLTLYEF